jgi:hypothetical protein
MIKRKPRQIWVLLFAMWALLFPMLSHADNPSGPVTTGGSGTLALEDEKHKKSIWKNGYEYYKRMKAKVMKYVRAVNSISDLCFSAYNMYKKWERISQRAAVLYNTNPFAGNTLEERVINAEMWFRESDDILYEAIPSAERTSARFNDDMAAWTEEFAGNGDYNKTTPRDNAEAIRNAYIASRLGSKTADPEGIIYMGILDSMHQANVLQNAETYASLIHMDKTIEQEVAANRTVSADAWNLASCQGSSTQDCGGITQRADMENRSGIMQNRLARIAGWQASTRNSVLMQEILLQVQNWSGQGNLGVVLLNGSRRAYKAIREANGLDVEEDKLPIYLQGLYPHAYRYDGKTYNDEGVLIGYGY